MASPYTRRSSQNTSPSTSKDEFIKNTSRALTDSKGTFSFTPAIFHTPTSTPAPVSGLSNI